MITWDTVTVWHKQDKGFTRSIYQGVHVEEKLANTASTVGPQNANVLKVWFFRDPGLKAGDFVIRGISSDEKPVSEARMVRSVNPYSTHHETHHVEVEAR